MFTLMRRKRDDDDDNQSNWIGDNFLLPRIRKDKIPEIKVTSLNEKYDNYSNAIKFAMPGSNESALFQKYQKLIKLVSVLHLTFVLNFP